MSLADKGGSKPGGPKDPSKPVPQNFFQKCADQLKKIFWTSIVDKIKIKKIS